MDEKKKSPQGADVNCGDAGGADTTMEARQLLEMTHEQKRDAIRDQQEHQHPGNN